MHAFSQQVALTRKSLTKWKSTGQSSLDKSIAKTEEDISIIEAMEPTLDYSDLSSLALRSLYNKHQALLRQNSIKWAQRARLLWLRHGDCNTKFFHNHARIRAHKNKISAIIDDNNHLFSEHQDIERVFSSFYAALWASSSRINCDELASSLPADLPTLSADDSCALIRPVTTFEIFQTLKSMPKGKRPGPDGLNVEFYLFYWDIVKGALIRAINHFFQTATLPCEWGRTYIVLIPKNDSPNRVTDYRPISLCNVSYKIISKILTNRLKGVMHKLVGIEQSGFLAGRTAFDNIITVQEIAHSLEFDSQSLPRMLVKIDIEKAYDALEWNSILATLKVMRFPDIWISWVKTCITNTSFAFLLNGKPTHWFASQRGIRQGDPLSPFLFLLVSQNLTVILNQAMSMGMVPGFDHRLLSNFNHLMFADDLIIITRASRIAARNCKLCLDIYRDLTGQKANLNKSSIHFPSWINKRIGHSIGSILGMKLGSFPFKYLGAKISPKRIPVQQWQDLIDRTRNSLNAWNPTSISLAGRAVLINSSLMSIPTYSLSCCLIPDTILDGISKLTRNFLWGRGAAGGNFHSINWNTITLAKTEGGLGIRNLRHAKISLMAKNVFAVVNQVDKHWIQILQLKYGEFNPWSIPNLSRTSCFFRMLCKAATVIRPNMCINTCNYERTNFLNDPWLFDIPLSLKPTYINMELPLDNLCILDFLHGTSVNLSDLQQCFGNTLDGNRISKMVFDPTCSNHWIWLPNSSNGGIASMVYNYLNQRYLDDYDNWNGWGKMWKLPMPPRVKVFMWKMLHGRVSTFQFLYNLNIGPQMPCPFCQLENESLQHLMNNCYIARQCWGFVTDYLGINLSDICNLVDGQWVTAHWNCHHISMKQAKALVATCAWAIWKARCDLVFNNIRAQPLQIFHHAVNSNKQYLCSNQWHLREYLFSSKFNDSLTLFCDASYIDSHPLCGIGFIAIAGADRVIFAGYTGLPADSSLQAELMAAAVAMQQCLSSNLMPSRLCTDCLTILNMINIDGAQFNWQNQPYLMQLMEILKQNPALEISYCPREINDVADSLANYGRLNPELSLFHRGIDRPRWLENAFAQAGLLFC